MITLLLMAAFGNAFAAALVLIMLFCMVCAVVHPYVQRRNARLRRRQRRHRAAP